MTHVIEVTDQNFVKEVLESDVPTEVDFWAPWCGPCQMVSPIYDKISGEYKDFKFCKIDVDQNPQTAKAYNIMSIPMQMFFANGEKVDEILGAVPEHVIRAKVQEIQRRFPTDEKGRVMVILTSWIEQNRRHEEKFERWKEKAGHPELERVYGPVLAAVRGLEEANEQLSKTLAELGDK